MDPARCLTSPLSPAFLAVLTHISLQQAQPLPSQALLAGDRNPGVGSLAQVAGREAETGTCENRVVLDKTGLGGCVPRGGAPAVPTSCPYARASVGRPRLGLGLEVEREGVAEGWFGAG